MKWRGIWMEERNGALCVKTRSVPDDGERVLLMYEDVVRGARGWTMAIYRGDGSMMYLGGSMGLPPGAKIIAWGRVDITGFA